jgi:hypothetical protein
MYEAVDKTAQSATVENFAGRQSDQQRDAGDDKPQRISAAWRKRSITPLVGRRRSLSPDNEVGMGKDCVPVVLEQGHRVSTLRKGPVDSIDPAVKQG